MKPAWTKLGLLLVLLSTQALAAPEPTVKSSQRALPLCTLVRDSKSYEGKIVRIRGTAVTTLEEVVLMDTACPTLTSAVRWPPFQRGGGTKFDLMMQRFGSADVVFEGVFRGSDLIQLPGKGYGYLNSHQMLIEVIAVEEVRRTSVAGAKGPKPTDVTISDLSLHPRRFDGHLVRVRARVVFGFEGDDFLLDPFSDSMPFGGSATVWFYCKPENNKRVYGQLGLVGPGGIAFTGYFHYVRKTHIVNGAFDPGPLQFEAVDVSGTQLTKTGVNTH